MVSRAFVKAVEHTASMQVLVARAMLDGFDRAAFVELCERVWDKTTSAVDGAVRVTQL